MSEFTKILQANGPAGRQAACAKSWTFRALTLCLALLTACSGGSDSNAPPATPSWETVALPVNLIESVAVSPLDRRIVYAGQRNPWVNAEHAVWRSDDGGESFKPVAIGVSFHLFPSPTDPDRVFGSASEPDRYPGFGSTQAIYVSRNRGQSWQPAFADGKGILLNDADPGRGLAQHPQQRDTIYAFGRPRDELNGAVYKSSDGGASWTDVSPAGLVLNRYTGNFAFDPLHPDTVFLSTGYTAQDGSAGVLLRSLDGGKSWQAADRGLLLTSNEGSMAHQLNQLVVTTVPGVLVGVSQFGQLWINSDSGGGSWRPMPLPLGTVDQFLWSARLPNTLVILTRDGAMQRSDDLGNTWKPVAPPGKIAASVLDDSDPLAVLIVTANDDALYRSADGGQSWSPLAKPPFAVSYYPGDGSSGQRIAISVATPDHLIAFRASYGSLSRIAVLAQQKWDNPHGMESFRSTVRVSSLAAFGNRLAASGGGSLFRQDAQGTWNTVTLPDAYWVEGARLVSDGVQRGIFGGLYYVTRGTFAALFQGTVDGGEHWSANNRYNSYGGEAVFDTANGRFWYLGSHNKFLWDIYQVEADGSVKLGGSGLPPGILNALANSQQAPATLYVGTAQGIYRSTDGGSAWSPAAGGNAGSPVSAIAVDPKDAMTVWALGSSGLMRTGDGGARWTAVAPENFATGASALALHPLRSGVVAVAAPSGIWVSIDGGAKWKNVGGPKQGVRQILIVDDALALATDGGLFRCAALCLPL